MLDSSGKPVIFISFSQKDEPAKPNSDEVAWLTFVQSFLAPAVRTGIFDIWVDEHLHGGDVIDAEVRAKLAECDIFVLLVSRHSLASTYVIETEIATIRQRQRNGEAVRIFPIVLSPVPAAALRVLGDLRLYPRDGESLSVLSRDERERWMTEIADEIAGLAQEIHIRKSSVVEASEHAPFETPNKKTSIRESSARTDKRGAAPISDPLDLRTFASGFSADRTDGIDALDIGPDVEAFAQLICLESARPPLSIALFGSWGSGKTFFMERLLEKVDDLTNMSIRSRNENSKTGNHRIVSNVVQVRFNAWHYSDANLWASLTAEFFDQLRAGGAGKKHTARYESLVELVGHHVRNLEADALSKSDEATSADRQLQRAEEDAKEARVQLSSVEEKSLAHAAGKTLSEAFEKNRPALKELGRQVYMDDLAADLEKFASAAREVATVHGKLKLVARVLKSGTLTTWLALLGLVLLLVVSATFVFSDLTLLALWIGQLRQWSLWSALTAFVVAFWNGYRLIKPVLNGASAFSKNVLESKQQLNAALVAKEAEVAVQRRRSAVARGRVDNALKDLRRYGGTANVSAPEAVLRYLLYDAVEGSNFEESLGIISRARRSFEKLDEIILRARGKVSDGEPVTAGQTPLSSVAVPDRIILYIDDLDRCTHKQVYEVLQAVHLLLALESFVVIVGVDIRWIEGAIANHFEADLGGEVEAPTSGESKTQDLRSMRRARAFEYLEKIFQIPFWLRTINSGRGGTYSKLMTQLLAENKPQNGSESSGTIPTESAEKLVSAQAERGELSGSTTADEAASVVLRDTLVRVTLTPEEYDFIQTPEIGRLVGKSPRAVKRFVNIYRILRARRGGKSLVQLSGADGQPPLFPVILLLLAIDVGQTSESARSFRRLIEGRDEQTFSEAIGVSETFAKEIKSIEGLDEAIKLASSLGAGELPMATWKLLIEEVRRYSFNDLRDG
ncbi:MAG: family P-loop domain protein [Bradyrhizobium sp.]|nr:family P-loop domain protein [Bradyrhizobium sp.]